MIALDAKEVGTVNPVAAAEARKEREEYQASKTKKGRLKTRTRGVDKTVRKTRVKNLNVITKQRVRLGSPHAPLSTGGCTYTSRSVVAVACIYKVMYIYFIICMHTTWGMMCVVSRLSMCPLHPSHACERPHDCNLWHATSPTTCTSAGPHAREGRGGQIRTGCGTGR